MPQRLLEFIIDATSMPLKNMGLKDSPFKRIINFHFLNECLVAITNFFLDGDLDSKSFEDVPKVKTTNL